jgi:hypothetical protein
LPCQPREVVLNVMAMFYRQLLLILLQAARAMVSSNAIQAEVEAGMGC